MRRTGWQRTIALALVGSSLFLGGCDPTIRATAEEGIINTSTSLLTAFMRALLEVAGEARDAQQ